MTNMKIPAKCNKLNVNMVLSMEIHLSKQKFPLKTYL